VQSNVCRVAQLQTSVCSLCSHPMIICHKFNEVHNRVEFHQTLLAENCRLLAVLTLLIASQQIHQFKYNVTDIQTENYSRTVLEQGE